MQNEELPKPPKIKDQEALDLEQKLRAQSYPMMGGGDVFRSRAYAVINELKDLPELNKFQQQDYDEAIATLKRYE